MPGQNSVDRIIESIDCLTPSQEVLKEAILCVMDRKFGSIAEAFTEDSSKRQLDHVIPLEQFTIECFYDIAIDKDEKVYRALVENSYNPHDNFKGIEKDAQYLRDDYKKIFDHCWRSFRIAEKLREA